MLAALITFIVWAIAKFFSRRYETFMAGKDVKPYLPMYVLCPYLIGKWFTLAFCLWLLLMPFAINYQDELKDFTGIGIDDFAINHLFLGLIVISVFRPLFIYKKYRRHCKELESNIK